MDQLKMTEAQRKATLSDGQDAGEMLLDIEARIGELALQEPTARPKPKQGLNGKLTGAVPSGAPPKHERLDFPSKLNMNAAEAIHKNPAIVAKIKAPARENEDILGDAVNYAIGKYLGPKVFHYEGSRFFRREHLQRTHDFYEKYGGKTIVIARFMPIIRTFAPFVAGIGRMTYRRFALYKVAGGIFWIVSMLLAGYYFGNIALVKENFTIVLLAIVFLSVLPGGIEFVRQRSAAGR